MDRGSTSSSLSASALSPLESFDPASSRHTRANRDHVQAYHRIPPVESLENSKRYSPLHLPQRSTSPSFSGRGQDMTDISGFHGLQSSVSSLDGSFSGMGNHDNLDNSLRGSLRPHSSSRHRKERNEQSFTAASRAQQDRINYLGHLMTMLERHRGSAIAVETRRNAMKVCISMAMDAVRQGRLVHASEILSFMGNLDHESPSSGPAGLAGSNAGKRSNRSVSPGSEATLRHIQAIVDAEQRVGQRERSGRGSQGARGRQQGAAASMDLLDLHALVDDGRGRLSGGGGGGGGGGGWEAEELPAPKPHPSLLSSGSRGGSKGGKERRGKPAGGGGGRGEEAEEEEDLQGLRCLLRLSAQRSLASPSMSVEGGAAREGKEPGCGDSPLRETRMSLEATLKGEGARWMEGEGGRRSGRGAGGGRRAGRALGELSGREEGGEGEGEKAFFVERREERAVRQLQGAWRGRAAREAVAQATAAREAEQREEEERGARVLQAVCLRRLARVSLAGAVLRLRGSAVRVLAGLARYVGAVKEVRRLRLQRDLAEIYTTIPQLAAREEGGEGPGAGAGEAAAAWREAAERVRQAAQGALGRRRMRRRREEAAGRVLKRMARRGVAMGERRAAAAEAGRRRAAGVLQRVVRGHRARRGVREGERGRGAAECVGRWLLRWATQRVVREVVLRERGRQGAAAERLQAGARRARTQGEAGVKRRVRRAVVEVQRCWRGHQGRHFYLRELSRQWRGAVPIQAAVRRGLVLPLVLRLRTEAAAEMLRRVLRAREARARYIAAREEARQTVAARVMQRWARRAVAVEAAQEAWVQEGRFATSVASIVGGLWGSTEAECQVAVDGMGRASQELQRVWRGHAGREAGRRAAAAMRLKVSARRAGARRGLGRQGEGAVVLQGAVRRAREGSLGEWRGAVGSLEPVLWRAVVRGRLGELWAGEREGREEGGEGEGGGEGRRVDAEAVAAAKMELLEMHHRGKGWEDGDSFQRQLAGIVEGLWGGDHGECSVAGEKRQAAGAGAVQRVWRGHWYGRRECQRERARERLRRFVQALAGRGEAGRVRAGVEGLQAAARRRAGLCFGEARAAAEALELRVRRRREREEWLAERDRQWLAGRIGEAQLGEGEGGFAAQLAAIVGGLGEEKVDREVGARRVLQAGARRAVVRSVGALRGAAEVLESGVRRALLQEQLMEERGFAQGYTVRVCNILGSLAGLDQRLLLEPGEALPDQLSPDFREGQQRQQGAWEDEHRPWVQSESARELLRRAQQLMAADAFAGVGADLLAEGMGDDEWGSGEGGLLEKGRRLSRASVAANASPVASQGRRDLWSANSSEADAEEWGKTAGEAAGVGAGARRECSALQLQRVWRGHLARAGVEAGFRLLAAMRLQRAVRGHFGRRLAGLRRMGRDIQPRWAPMWAPALDD